MKRLLLACCFATITTGAWAQSCTVADPTGTPLNVRAGPNGAILGALYNGTTVQILRRTVDANGKSWAYIAPQGAGRNGWVFSAFLSCR
jgi:uncharacterized protein YraI